MKEDSSQSGINHLSSQQNEGRDEYGFTRSEGANPPDFSYPKGQGPAHKSKRKGRRSRTARSSFIWFCNMLFTLALLALVAFIALTWYGKIQFKAPGPLTQFETFKVPKGASFNSIVPELEEKNIIAKQGVLQVFVRGVRAANKITELKAGEFAFSPKMSMHDVMMQLTEGRAIEFSLTFPEGWTSYKIMQRIAADPILVGELPPVPAEGTLMASTFSFPRGMTREQLVERMKKLQSDALARIWAKRQNNLPLRSPEELLILASIVEKETAVPSERGHIASVFMNRLRRNIPLQTDPTVIYGIWGGEGKPKGRGGLRRSELDKATPYNTYKIRGLPPGPIATPGVEAMEAVAHPDQTDDLYFVANGTGGHAFAKTLEEHNANVRKWRKIEAERKANAAAAEKKKAEDEGDQLRTNTN